MIIIVLLTMNVIVVVIRLLVILTRCYSSHDYRFIIVFSLPLTTMMITDILLF